MRPQVSGVAVDDATMASVVAAPGSSQQPVALEHAAGQLGDDAYLTRLRALRAQRDAITERTTPGVPGQGAVARGAGSEIIGARLTAAAYAHGLALALPEKAAMARPTGAGRALATYEIPIEGRDEWVAAARRLA